MPKHGENIRKRVDGRWEGRYKAGVRPDGRSRYHSVYGHSYREVKERLRHAEPTVEPGEQPLRFRDVLQCWQQEERQRKLSTKDRYAYLIQAHILPELGDIRMDSLTAQTINAFAERKLKQGSLRQEAQLSPAYVRSIMLIITSALRYAEREGMCLPIRGQIYKPGPESHELAVLSFREQQLLQQYLMEHLDHTALGILLSLNTGLRIGEVCGLRWTDVDLQRELIHVRATVVSVRCEPDSPQKTKLILDKPKTKSSLRDIPVPSRLIALLGEQKAAAKGEFVVSDSDAILSPRTFAYRYHRILERCGISSINYHALRHTFATRCIELGMDVKSLSEILGHANVSITLNTYVHPSMDHKRMLMEQVLAF